MPVNTIEKLTTATKASAETFTKSGTAALAGAQELAKAYQALAVKNTEKLAAAFQAFAAVKSPTEFVALQQKFIKEGVESAVAESKTLAELTVSIFTSAFVPAK